MVKIKYKELSDFTTAQTLQKISNTPTTSTNACAIRKVIKEVQTLREKISGEYQAELVQKYALKNEDGTVKRPDGEPNGFDPNPEKMEEFMKDQAAFGEREGEINARPFTPSMLNDVKLSATELESLKALFTEEEGPGLPVMGNLR